MLSISEGPWGGWPCCITILNAHIKLVVSADVGPRILYCGPADKEVNLFHIHEAQRGLRGGDEWRHYGGHRLWTSPQEGSRPNQPDNEQVPYDIRDNTVTLRCSTEKATMIRKELRITVDSGKPQVTVGHRIFNCGLWPIALAPWALSMMQKDGVEILPVPRDRPRDYMPNYAICFWPWTKPNDRRFTLGEKYMMLRHDKTNNDWFKIGYRNTEGWGAYISQGYMFVKTYKPIPGKKYPDYGSTFETYMDGGFTELETLGPLETLCPGAYTEHTEQWYLFDKVPVPETEDKIEKNIARLIQDVI